MKIHSKIIPFAYEVAKLVYNDNLTPTQGKKKLSSDGQMNENSANDYITNFKSMLSGRKFSRTLNRESMEYFLSNIRIDYGVQSLSKALLALWLHIEYYEQSQNTTMHQMRALFEKYSNLVPSPQVITELIHLENNIETLENSLTIKTETIRSTAQQLVMQGTCFVAYSVGEEMRFAPSRYLGYKDNKPFKYILGIDGRETNKVISKMLGLQPIVDPNLEALYLSYCNNLGIKPNLKGAYGHPRKYWKLELQHEFEGNIQIEGEFPEGKIVERVHKARERSSEVVKLAKLAFKKKHGKLFCQVCYFDFENKYGTLGKDFIEGHHTVAVSDMIPGHKTRVEDIAMLCSNCHRMVHTKRPWLNMEKLNQLIKKP